MNITLYGPETEKYEHANELSALPDCRYRNICIKGFSDYDSFISNLGEGPPELVLVTADGAAGMEGVIAAKSLLKNVPVVWFSNDSGFGAQSYRLGCAYFHPKPVSAEILSAAIAKCV